MRQTDRKGRRGLCIALLLSLIMTMTLSPTALAAVECPEIGATGAVVMDYDTGALYYEKEADTPRPAASMTKVMSAYLVFEEIAAGRLSLDSYVTASAYAAAVSNHVGYSGLEHLQEGGQYTVDTLLRLIFTASCNGSVIVLAENIAGSEAAFVQRMNAKAEELGLNAHYADCCGLKDEGNAVSPRAMAQLARRIIQDYPIILQYTTLKSTVFQGKTFYSTNKLLREGSVAGIDGLKTGSTGGAGYCFTGTAKQNGRRIIAVVMNTRNGNQRMSECKSLLEYGFSCRQEQETVWKKEAASTQVTVTSSRESLLPYETTELTATVSGLPAGSVIPCTVSWTVNGAAVGEKESILVENGKTVSLPWTAQPNKRSGAVVCTLQFPFGKTVKGKVTVPVTQKTLTLSGYLGVRRVEMYQESRITVPCKISCEQGVALTLSAGWYLDGQPIPGYQNAAFRLTPEARSAIDIKGASLKPGEHVLEFRCNTTDLPGIQKAALKTEILILTDEA